MRPRKNRTHRTDAEHEPAPVPEIPVQVTFRHMPVSRAVVERVTHEAQKLRRYAEAIKHCHAVVIAPHRHLRRGRRYAVHLELGLPRQLVAIAHEPPARARVASAEKPTKRHEVAGSAKDLSVEIRRVFDVARRRLQDHMRLLRGDVKSHASAQARK
jgi:ribosome-associated translation inhibitor RaiA